MRIGRFAPWYRWVEYVAFGRALERRRFAFLPRLASARCVLVLGEGDGRTVERLLTLAPQANIDVVEISPEMIELAKQRVGNSARVSFRCANALTYQVAEKRQAEPPAPPRTIDGYDAIVTNFFLDCFDPADARLLIGRLAKVLTPGGTWLIAEFAIPPRGWQRIHARIWIWTMYRFFGITAGLRARQLPEIEALMREAGLTRTEHQHERGGLMISEVWRR